MVAVGWVRGRQSNTPNGFLWFGDFSLPLGLLVVRPCKSPSLCMEMGEFSF